MRKVICVLKTGGWEVRGRKVFYTEKHVKWMQRQVEKHAPDVPFVCLSNIDIPGVDVIPLEHDWPGWWAKMELFRLDIGPVLYLDLDMVITGPLDELMSHPHEFSSKHNSGKSHTSMNSSVMLWSGPRPDIYDPFIADPQRWMRECADKRCWGDQGFIERHVTHWDCIEDLFPGAVVSYKRNVRRSKTRKPRPETRIVSFHGKPKPWEVQHDWVPKC